MQEDTPRPGAPQRGDVVVLGGSRLRVACRHFRVDGDVDLELETG
jgi:hypothetical protein